MPPEAIQKSLADFKNLAGRQETFQEYGFTFIKDCYNAGPESMEASLHVLGDKAGRKVAVFINGCFWHRCPRCNPSTPRKNTEYWTAKFARNVERDRENLEALRTEGWTVHVIWECQLKKATREETFAELLPELSRELDKPLN